MTEPILEKPDSFAYQAQTTDGQTVAGTIDAQNIEHAQRLLNNLRLRVLQIEPTRRPIRTKRLNGDDFLSFNQQLTHLTTAGLPVEHGLRLIAQDMRTGRCAQPFRRLPPSLSAGRRSTRPSKSIATTSPRSTRVSSPPASPPATSRAC
jgi:type II secretory pathway component PulF